MDDYKHIKKCVDCRWNKSGAYCTKPHVLTGERLWMDAASYRADSRACGIEARFFEPKPPKKPNIIKRMVSWILGRFE